MKGTNSAQLPTIEPPFKQQILTGMFRPGGCAERAYSSVCDRGYVKDDINLLMSDRALQKFYSNHRATEERSEVPGQIMDEAIVGEVNSISAIAGIISLLDTCVLIPGLGMLIAGPLAVNMVHADAKSLTGGTKGALVGLGISEARAAIYESGIQNGSVLLGVSVRNEADAVYFEHNWNTNSGAEIYR